MAFVQNARKTELGLRFLCAAFHGNIAVMMFVECPATFTSLKACYSNGSLETVRQAALQRQAVL